MLNYIKSVIRSFFSTPSTIVFIEPIVEGGVEEPKVKKASKKSLKTKHKPRARKKKAIGRKPIYPYRTTPIGGGFKMKNQMNGDIYKALQKEGIYYSQHKVKGGILAYRKA
jgi:hypothetical protein